MATDDILLRSRLKLGKKLLEEKRFAEARTVYEQICARRRNDAHIWFTLGVINGLLRRHDEAVTCCTRATELAPQHTAAWYNLGIALRDSGQTEPAAAALQQALRLEPRHEAAATSLGHVLASLHRYEEAEEIFRNVLAYQPGNAEFYAVYGSAMQSMGRFEAAIQAYNKAIDMHHPRLAEVRENLAAALCLQGKFSESLQISEAALAAQPGNPRIYSGLLLTLQYASADKDYLLERHRKWPGNALFSGTRTARRLATRPDRLRIGYVSSDFRRHSVAYFIEPLLLHHDHVRHEITCYFSHNDADATTARLKVLAHRWRNIAGLDDQQLLQQISDDEIDILVDLNGHTAGGRLTAFARRAAPVQVSFIGYPDTTGLTEMDYRITDALADPPGAEQWCTETLLRLPGCFLCYRPQASTPAVAPAPCTTNGFITFGSFNNLAKLSPDTIATWSALLHDVPDSRLVLKNPSLTDKATRERYAALFSAAGIGADRLDLLGFIADDRGHLGAYDRIDIALDTFPYNGTTTTCEALWMGVPVVTLRGDRHAARVGASLLTAVGHGEWIADTTGHYIQIARELGLNLPVLASQREHLREQVQASALCNAEAYTRTVELAYDEMISGTLNQAHPG